MREQDFAKEIFVERSFDDENDLVGYHSASVDTEMFDDGAYVATYVLKSIGKLKVTRRVSRKINKVTK